MPSNEKTWKQVFQEQVRAQAAVSENSEEEIANVYFQNLTAKFEEAGLDIQEDIDFSAPWRPISVVIEERKKEIEGDKAAERTSAAARSPSDQERSEELKRIGAATMRPWARGMAPAAEKIFPEQMITGDPQSITLEREYTPKKPDIEFVKSFGMPETRGQMIERLGYNLTQAEYEELAAEDVAERALEATTVNGRPLEDLMPEEPHKVERRRRVIEAAETVRKKRNLSEGKDTIEQQEYIAKLRESSPGLRKMGGGWKGGVPGAHDLPEEEPNWENKAETESYINQLSSIPAVRYEYQDKIWDEAYRGSGGALGVMVRPLAAIAGATASTGVMAAQGVEGLHMIPEDATFWKMPVGKMSGYGVMPQIQAPLAALSRSFGSGELADTLERQFHDNERAYSTGKHWSQKKELQGAGFEAAIEGFKHNENLIESRLKDKKGWANIKGDFGDNVAGLGHLVSVFMPTSLDVLNAIEAGKDKPAGEEGTWDGNVSRALLTFKYGFKQGQQLPAGMAGAILSILADPYGAVQAQPITTAMTLFPIFKLLKAAKVKGAGAMFDALEANAKKAGIDLNEMSPYSLVIPENMQATLINEARINVRTRWGGIVESKIGQQVLHNDYVAGVVEALETGTKLPELQMTPGLSRTAKATATTYVLSGEENKFFDPDDPFSLKGATIALGTFGAPAGLLAWASQSARFGPSVARSKASLQRLAVDIGVMSDPLLTAKVQTMVDRVVEGRNIIESDMKTLQQALGRQGTKIELEKIIPDLGEILAARAALKGSVEAIPAVKKLRVVYEDTALAYESAKKAGMTGEALELMKTDLLTKRAEYRAMRAKRLVETANNPNIIMPETGATNALTRLMENTKDLQLKYADDIYELELKQAAEVQKLEGLTTPEKINQYRNDVTSGELAKVGIRTRDFSRDQVSHLERLKKLEDTVKSRTGEEFNKAVAQYEAQVQAARNGFDARLEKSVKGETYEITAVQKKLMEDMRKAETELLESTMEIQEASATATTQVADARAALLEAIKRKRAEVASRVSTGVKKLKKEGTTRVERAVGTKERMLERLQKKHAADLKKKSDRYDEAQKVNDESIKTAETTIETHNTRAAESLYLGEVFDEGGHVFKVEAPVRFQGVRDVDGKAPTYRMEYLDPDGMPTERTFTDAETQTTKTAEAGMFPDDSVAVAKKLHERDPNKVEGAYDLQSLANLTEADASSVLGAISRLATKMAESDLGFEAIVNGLEGRKTKGAGGGTNLASRIYTQILSDILISDRSAALLRSPKLRNRFSSWLDKEIGGAIDVPVDAVVHKTVMRKTISMQLGKLVNDYAFGRTKGTRYIEINPVFELADGRTVKMGDLYNKYMDQHGNPKNVYQARVEALDSFRQQMIGKVEEAQSAKWFWEQVGTMGWFDDGISPRYLADIGDYLAREGHMPPVLKKSPKEMKSLLRAGEAEVVQRMATKIMERNPGMSLGKAVSQASTLTEQLMLRFSELGGETTKWVAWKDNILPSLRDRGAYDLSKVDDSAGIARWKAPVAVDDMAGWSQMMGKLGKDAVVNSDLGGGNNSTLGWLFMASRAMHKGGWMHGFRQASSAIKRNLTTQRPQTAMTNFMSNYLAMITREGLLPQQAAFDLTATAKLWNQFSKDPTSVAPPQRARIKGMFDRGLAANNSVTVDANIAIDSFANNLPARIGNAYATGLRDAPVTGKIMKGMDWAYQAGDGIFKLTDALRAVGRLDNWAKELRPGNSITFKDPSRGGKIMGRVFRDSDGAFEVHYKGKKHRGKAAAGAIENLKLDTAVGYANSMYFDYSRVPGFIELARNFDALGFGPFKTWAWKSLDIPFLKKGMGTRALFGDTMIVSSDANIMGKMYANESLVGMRKAAIMGLTRTNTRDDEYLRKLLPEWIAPTAFFNDETTSFQSMGNRNFVINLSNIIDAAWKMTRGEEEDILFAKLRKSEKAPHAEIANLVWADGLVVGTLTDLSQGVDAHDRPLSGAGDYYRYLSGKLMPGWLNATTDTLGTVWDDMAPLSGLARANKWRDGKTRMNTASYLVKIWTGRRLEHFDRKQIYGVLSELAGRYQSGAKKGQKKPHPRDLVEKHFKKKYDTDVKQYVDQFDPSPEQLKTYSNERKDYWIRSDNSQLKLLRGVYDEMWHDVKDAWQRQREASDDFKSLVEGAKKGSEADRLKLGGALDAQSDELENADTMIDLAGDNAPWKQPQ